MEQTNVSEQEIKSFIQETFLYGDPFDLGNEASFLEMGIIDSTGVLQLVAFLEKAFGIKVLDEELVPENLDSLSAILQYIDRKKSTAGKEAGLG